MTASEVMQESSSGSDDSPEPPAEIAQASAQERVSYYMHALDELVALKDTEGFLFNAYEHAALNKFSQLPYESRYLFIRLFLRKQGWTRLRKLQYNEIGDVKVAAEQLCAELDLPHAPSSPPKPKRRRSATDSNGVEVLDLTGDSSDEEAEEEASPAESEGTLGDLSRIAYSSASLATASPAHVLALLSLEELQELGRKLSIKVKINTRKEWSEALLRTSKQATLNFGSNSFGMSYDAQGRKTHQMSRVLAESLSVIGESIRLTPAFYDLFCRLALILHRTTYITATASAKGKGKASNLTSSLLARFGKRAYPSYKVQRTSVFPSRLLLVKFESALALEAKMVDLLELPGSREERRLRWIEGVNIARDVHDDWRAAVKECKKRDQDFEYYKLRFHPGWAWTRVLHKAVRMHASLGNHAAEIEILTDLLAPDQPFRKGKRGAWADRLALVTMHYPTSLEEKCKDEKAKDKMKRKRLKRAKAIVEHALQDGRTHIIFVPQLSRRLARLHRMLDLAPPATVEQRKASTRVMEGTRLDDGELGKHSIWRANDGDEVGVEALALEGYRRLGWQGRHAETGVLSMLFVLLFWDVIFDDTVPGVFETPWQSEPLDLRTDAFAVSRRGKIDERLNDIRQGRAAELVVRTDANEREKGTFAIGVSWARFTSEEMQEIATCFEKEALATIMKAFAEEYGHRTGGVPDLCLWNAETKEVMFAEVKGPGDTLSETQKVWIDVLLGANVATELCKVMTTDDKMELERNAKTKKRGRKRSRSDDDSDE